MGEDVLALIPARGGSKGIPRKNVMEIGGKPLVAWSILHARESSRITRIVVSTDDAEIASIAEHWGAEVPFLRPPEYSEDASPDIDAFRHALEYLAGHEAYRPDLVVHLRPTGPVRRIADIDAAIDLLTRHPEADAVRSVSLARQTPYKMWELCDDGTMQPVLRLPDLPDCQSRPRQALPLVYAQNGYVDVLRPRAVLEKNSMWGNHVLPFVMDTTLVDLDYPEDVEPVERALALLEQGHDLPREHPGRHPV